MNPMDHDSHPDSAVARLLALKRLESPPQGHQEFLTRQIMRSIAAERIRPERPWWIRYLEAVTSPRGMQAANVAALAGLAFLAVATFHVVHTSAHQELEEEVYAALPLPDHAGMGQPSAHPYVVTVSEPVHPSNYRPIPSSGATVPIHPAFAPHSALTQAKEMEAPKWLFQPPSRSNPKFILATDRQ